MIKQERIIDGPEREHLIAKLWNERRGRVPSQSLQSTSLFITVPSMDVSIDEVFNGLLNAMVSSNTDMLYKWASNWGQTRITVHAQKGLSFQYMNRLSREAKSYEFLTTNALIDPKRTFGNSQNDNHAKYHILLGDSPVRIEGAILQAERMMDELVWCVSEKKKLEGMGELEAYGAALTDVKENGFDFRYVSAEDILALKQEEPELAVRIYGNFLNRETVPQIVGAICPLDKEITLPEENLSDLPTIRGLEKSPKSSEKKENVDNQIPFVAIGITLAKQPHIGHMLLASIAASTSRILDNAPICIDGNDTGPRVNAAIKYGARVLGVSTQQVIKGITDGTIGISTVEEWYRDRKNIDDRTIIQDSKIEGELSLVQQARNTQRIFKDFFGDKSDVKIILESQILEETDQYLEVGDSCWSGTGFSCINMGNRLLILEREGNPSSEAIRATFIGCAAKQLQRGKAYFVDSDPQLKDVFHVNKLATSKDNVQIPGTAIGFNFEIASGTSGNSMPMEAFLSWYKEKYPNSDVVADISYLVHTRYQVLPFNEPSFFNYKDIESFLTDVQRSHDERTIFIKETEGALFKLKEKLNADSDNTSFSGEKKERKRGQYVLNILREIKDSLINGSAEVYSQAENLKESPEVCQAIDLKANERQITKEEARLTVLKEIALDNSNLDSRFINQLKNQGFRTGEELATALEVLCSRGLGLARLTNVLYATANYLIEVSNRVEVIDKNTLKMLNNLHEIVVGKI